MVRGTLENLHFLVRPKKTREDEGFSEESVQVRQVVRCLPERPCDRGARRPRPDQANLAGRGILGTQHVHCHPVLAAELSHHSNRREILHTECLTEMSHCFYCLLSVL